jgi:hypothetical protein
MKKVKNNVPYLLHFYNALHMCLSLPLSKSECLKHITFPNFFFPLSGFYAIHVIFWQKNTADCWWLDFLGWMDGEVHGLLSNYGDTGGRLNWYRTVRAAANCSCDTDLNHLMISSKTNKDIEKMRGKQQGACKKMIIYV